MTNALRRIAPLAGHAVAAPPDLGPRPTMQWVPPTALLVDTTYQRDLSRTTLRVLRRTIQEFAWARYKPPIVVPVARSFHIIDGQHTAIAAATLGLDEIPVFGELYT